MLNITAMFFVKQWQRTQDGGLDFAGAVWDRINIYPNDPPDGGCPLVVLMQTDEPSEPSEAAVKLEVWRTDVASPTVHRTSSNLDPTVTGRNRYGAMVIPGAFFREPGDYAVTAALGDRDPTAYLRVAVVAGT
jgi:hypothetical protein